MGLDRAQRPPRLNGDLVETQLAEEAERDHLAVRFVETADGRPDPSRALRLKRGDGRVRPAGQIDPGGWVRRVDPRHVAAALGTSERGPHGDPCQPCAEWTIATPAGEASEGGHERLLGCIFSLMGIAEHPVAGANDSRCVTLDQESKRIPIAGQDGFDSGALINNLGLDRC